jgi:hypothetical protein
LREIAGPIFFVNRNFPISPQDMFHMPVDSPNFDVLATWVQMDTFRSPHMMEWNFLEPMTSYFSTEYLQECLLSPMTCVSSNVEAVIEVEPSAFVHTIADSEPEMDEEDLDMLHATQVLL